MPVSSQTHSDPRNALVQRIAASDRFRRAPRLREMLLHVAEAGLRGDLDELTEVRIGQRVFGKPDGYNPSEDTIVRVTARQLRVKIDDYFAAEGKDETWRLHIPKGAYVPVFAEQPVSPAPAAAAGRFPNGFTWAAVACALAIGLAAGLWREAAVRPVPARPNLLTEIFGADSRPIVYVATDSAANHMHVLRDGKLLALDGYVNRSHHLAPPGLDEDGHRSWKFLTSRQITSLADLLFVSRLLRQPALAERLQVRHALQMTGRDFKSDHAIIHGGPTSNPWCQLFEDRLDFRMAPAGSVIENRQPRPGEPSEFRATGGESAARLAVVRNLTGSGAVLLVGGLGQQATEAMGDFLLDPESLALVRQRLGRPVADAPAFELVVTTRTVGGSSRAGGILASRP